MMREYLCTFLEEYRYPLDATAVLLDAYDRIAANAEAREAWEGALALYEADCCCDSDTLIGKADEAAERVGIHAYTAELLLFLCLSRHLRTLYCERGICLDYYQKSMEDLRYKLDECRLVYGIVGSFVAKWFVGFFRLTRFGIGRLQFEVVPFGSDYEKGSIKLTPTSKALNVHIPRSGEPLTEEACREAYLAAKAFFAEEIGDEPCPFVCHSWLLDPGFEDFLPKNTNTYRFYKSFDIYAVEVDKDRKNLWRLFDTMEQNPEKLPANTSLRRAFIEHLKKGGTLSVGRGVLFA